MRSHSAAESANRRVGELNNSFDRVQSLLQLEFSMIIRSLALALNRDSEKSE
jgi:hypothetical protein